VERVAVPAEAFGEGWELNALSETHCEMHKAAWGQAAPPRNSIGRISGMGPAFAQGYGGQASRSTFRTKM
jgi:hypothetical protein